MFWKAKGDWNTCDCILLVTQCIFLPQNPYTKIDIKKREPGPGWRAHLVFSCAGQRSQSPGAHHWPLRPTFPTTVKRELFVEAHLNSPRWGQATSAEMNLLRRLSLALLSWPGAIWGVPAERPAASSRAAAADQSKARDGTASTGTDGPRNHICQYPKPISHFQTV